MVKTDKMIIDIHNHIGLDQDGEQQSLTEFKNNLIKAKITHGVIFPFAGENLKEKSLDLLNQTKNDPNIFVFLRFNPQKMDKNTLIQLLNQGFKGVKLHPQSEKFDIADENYYWIYQIIQEFNIPILFHTKASQSHAHPLKVIELAKRFPNINFIIGHFFGDCFKTMSIVNQYPNVYSEISIFGRTLRISQMVNSGYDRLILGSDSPFDDIRISLMKIMLADINDVQKQKILCENAKKLLNIPTP